MNCDEDLDKLVENLLSCLSVGHSMLNLVVVAVAPTNNLNKKQLTSAENCNHRNCN